MVVLPQFDFSGVRFLYQASLAASDRILVANPVDGCFEGGLLPVHKLEQHEVLAALLILYDFVGHRQPGTGFQLGKRVWKIWVIG